MDFELSPEQQTFQDAVIAIRAVAPVCPRGADVVQAGNFGPIRVFAEYGTPAQKERFLRRLLAGEGVISVGMSEPDAGSAVTELKTTATPDGDGYSQDLLLECCMMRRFRGWMIAGGSLEILKNRIAEGVLGRLKS